jgi:hypothetical protein
MMTASKQSQDANGISRKLLMMGKEVAQNM